MPRKRLLNNIRFAVEIEVEFPEVKDSYKLIEKNRIIRGWELDYDASLDNGAEYRPKNRNHLYFNEDSLDQIKEIIGLIKAHKGHIRPTCFTQGTQILMSDYTQKDITKVKKGDFVLALDILSGILKSSKVLKTFKSKRPTITIDENFSVTPDHPFLYKYDQRWYKTPKNVFAPIEFLNSVYKIYNSNYKSRHEEDWYNGWLAGALDGDGWLINNYKKTYKNGIGFGSKDKELLEHFNLCLKKRKSRQLKIKFRKDKKQYYGTLQGKDIYYLLFNLYKNADNNPSESYMRGYLAGFYDTDGGLDNRNRIVYTNIETKLIKRLKYYLDFLGYRAFIGQGGKTTASNQIYRIITANTVKFFTECYPVLKRKYPKESSIFCQLREEPIIKSKIHQNGSVVYNIKTDLGTYIANGIPVHNCGLHVHIDTKKFTRKEIINIAKAFYKHQDYIYKEFKVLKSRERDNAKKLYKGMIETLNPRKVTLISRGDNAFKEDVFLDRDYGLNLYALNLHNTLEFRFFNGTIQARKIKHYIKWCLEFCINYAKNEKK